MILRRLAQHDEQVQKAITLSPVITCSCSTKLES